MYILWGYHWICWPYMFFMRGTIFKAFVSRRIVKQLHKLTLLDYLSWNSYEQTLQTQFLHKNCVCVYLSVHVWERQLFIFISLLLTSWNEFVWGLYYEGWLQDIYVKEITREYIWEHRQHWYLCHWGLRLNLHLETVSCISAYTAILFTILFHCYIQARNISQNRGNYAFFTLLKQQQNYFEKQANQGHMTEVMEWLDEMLWQVNPFTESKKNSSNEEYEYINKWIKHFYILILRFKM